MYPVSGRFVRGREPTDATSPAFPRLPPIPGAELLDGFIERQQTTHQLIPLLWRHGTKPGSPTQEASIKQPASCF